MQQWWNDNDRIKMRYWEIKLYHCATSSTTYLTWTCMGLNLGVDVRGRTVLREINFYCVLPSFSSSSSAATVSSSSSSSSS
jgi:hypothetical protein